MRFPFPAHGGTPAPLGSTSPTPIVPALPARHTPSLLATAVLLSCCAYPAMARAQAPAADAAATAHTTATAPDNDDARALPAVTVTARGTREQAKDVPFTVNRIDGTQLERHRLPNLEETLRRTPGVIVENMEGDVSANIRIRGVGSLYQSGPDSGFVGLTVDGVSLPGRDMSIGTLDLERIEVLKGPQGTLSGRTSEAGTVNIVSRRPTREREGYVRAEIGQEGQQLQEAAIGGPLGERLSGRVAIRHSGQDWWVDNLYTGKPEVEPRELAFRGSLLWQPSDGSSALLIAERQKSRHKPVPVVLMPYRQHRSLDVTPGQMDRNDRTHERFSLELNHDLANSRLTAISSLVRVDMHTVSLYDRNWYRAVMGMDMESALVVGVNDEKTFSQELRWQSRPDAPLFWTTGLYYAKVESHPYIEPGPLYEGAYNDLEHENRALFGEVTYPFAERWKLTGGLRHSWDDKRVRYHAVDQRAALKDDYTTGRAALTYALAPHTNVYGMLSRGYTSGGFKYYTTGYTGGRYDTDPTRPSATWSGELGFKTEDAERGIVLNGALFYGKTRDNHLWGTDLETSGVLIFNADTRNLGAELEGSWRVHPRLTLSGSLTYTRAEVVHAVTGVSGGDVAAGSAMKEVPRWSGSVSAEYRQPLTGLAWLPDAQLSVAGTYSYIGSRPADPQNQFDLKAYGKLDLRAGLQRGDLEVYVWADNLLDAEYDLYGYQYTPELRVGSPGRGRTLGAGVSWYF